MRLRNAMGLLIVFLLPLSAQEREGPMKGPKQGPPGLPPEFDRAIERLGVAEEAAEQIRAAFERMHEGMHALHTDMENQVREILGSDELFEELMQALRPQPPRGQQGEGGRRPNGQGTTDDPWQGPEGGDPWGEPKGFEGGENGGRPGQPRNGQGGGDPWGEPEHFDGGPRGGRQDQGQPPNGQGGEQTMPRGEEGEFERAPGRGPEGGRGNPGRPGEPRNIERALEKLGLTEEELEVLRPALATLSEAQKSGGQSVGTARKALEEALTKGADDATVEAKLAAVREAQAKHRELIQKAEAELLELLTPKQEAQLVQLGVLH